MTKLIKLGLISLVLSFVGMSFSRLQNYDIEANGSSDCSQSANCNLLENPGNSGSFQNSVGIYYAVIKADQGYFTFYGGASNDGCYEVSIDGVNISWNKLDDSSECQDVSHLQLWTKKSDPELTPTAEPTPTPPSFPSCASKTPPGDWEHYDYGTHQIVGNGLLEGADDVYSLDGGNYLQCFCSVNKDTGVETYWWRVGELAQDVIDYFTSHGWFYELGSQWNLGDYWYLAKNGNYDCSEPTPTPTETPTPTPTPTEQPTPTPTPGDEPESRCSGLSAGPTEGSAPLTVRFNGSGFDEDGEIQRYKFDFGDASGGQPQVWEQDESEAYHRYEYPGTYFASLHVKDSRGNWRNGNDDCRVEITVYGSPEVLGASTTSELPKTGTPAAIVVGLISLTSVGVYLRRRFRLA